MCQAFQEALTARPPPWVGSLVSFTHASSTNRVVFPVYFYPSSIYLHAQLTLTNSAVTETLR